MSIILFGRAITFSVSRLDITISKFSESPNFWVSPGFVLVPFGIFVFASLSLSSAPYVFTKCLRPLFKFEGLKGLTKETN